MKKQLPKEKKKQTELVKKVLLWYKKNKRDLPWRKTHDPYQILVSEIMLQQTQVDRVIQKYISFLEQFPDVHSLARAKSSEVIRAWQGLGYNRRALYLKRTAEAVVSVYSGLFPKDEVQLLTLPGIGPYTARAVLSFAFQTPVAVLDTNHRKLYRRLFSHAGSDAALLRDADAFIASLLKKQVYEWNQAIMDFVSAIERGEKDKTIRWFDEAYPEKKISRENKVKKSVPFIETNRYVRGRIVDALRGKRVIAENILQKQVGVSADRFVAGLSGLEKDGLIKRGKNGIMLP